MSVWFGYRFDPALFDEVIYAHTYRDCRLSKLASIRVYLMSMYQDVQTKLDEIVAEMKQIGLWQDEPLEPEKYDFRSAFAMDTMAFSQWLQFIFVPRVEQILVSQSTFPTRSQVGVQAIREFDGIPEATHLVALLCAFDELF